MAFAIGSKPSRFPSRSVTVQYRRTTGEIPSRPSRSTPREPSRKPSRPSRSRAVTIAPLFREGESAPSAAQKAMAVGSSTAERAGRSGSGIAPLLRASPFSSPSRPSTASPTGRSLGCCAVPLATTTDKPRTTGAETPPTAHPYMPSDLPLWFVAACVTSAVPGLRRPEEAGGGPNLTRPLPRAGRQEGEGSPRSFCEGKGRKGAILP